MWCFPARCSGWRNFKLRKIRISFLGKVARLQFFWIIAQYLLKTFVGFDLFYFYFIFILFLFYFYFIFILFYFYFILFYFIFILFYFILFYFYFYFVLFCFVLFYFHFFFFFLFLPFSEAGCRASKYLSKLASTKPTKVLRAFLRCAQQVNVILVSHSDPAHNSFNNLIDFCKYVGPLAQNWWLLRGVKGCDP